MLDRLIDAANAALVEKRNDKAGALLEAALPYAFNKAGILHRLANIHFNDKQWAEVAQFAAQATQQAGLKKREFINVCALLCISSFKVGGRAAAHAHFIRVRKVLEVLVENDVGGELERIDLLSVMYCAMTAGDHEFAAMLLRRALPPTTPWIDLRLITSSSMDVASWSSAQGKSPTQLDAPQHIAIPKSPPASEAWDYTTAGYRVITVANSEFVSGWDAVMTPEGVLLADSGYHPLDCSSENWFPAVVLEDTGLVLHPWPEQVETLDVDAIFLSTPGGFHIGHWMVDFIPRLRVLAHAPPTSKIIIPTSLPGKHRDMLRNIGIAEDRFLECDMGKRYRVRSLTVALPGTYLKPNPTTVRFVHDHLARKGEKTNSQPLRVFLKRDIGTRQIVNQAEVDDLLNELGFRQINLAKMTVAEQCEFFSERATIVGPFGSDLLCIFFAQPGSRIIELTWDKALDPCTGPTAYHLGIEHQFMICPEARETAVKQYRKDRDFYVDCKELKKRILAESPVAFAKVAQL